MISFRVPLLLLAFAGGAFLLIGSGCATAPKPVAAPATNTTSLPAPKSEAPAARESAAPAAQVAIPPTSPAVAQGTSPAAVTAVPPVERPPAPAPAPQAPVGARATIRGSQETSLLLDNYTAFVASVDGRKIRVGRDGWDIPVQLEAGRRMLELEFNRGVFVARARVELEAESRCAYEVRYQTDAELFGQNSYCKFWIVDTATGKVVSLVKRAPMEKIVATAAHETLP